uniref:RCC1 and BTB domain-containing protein 1 n=2 Tax=Lygus hesperus TaxID=30085 RepID=A0A0A9WBZ6_LYGHE
MLRNWVIFNKVPTEQLIRVKHIHVFEGGRSALYVTSGDIVYGVGANGNYNLLGLSGRHRQFSLVLEPVSVERLSLKSINTIAVGDYFGVANNTNGELYHWGRRMDKRRGILLPHQVKCPYFVVDVACGSEFFIILTKEQKVFFRGTFQQNDHPILEFTEVSSGLSVSSISCGIFHAAMITTDGQVYNCGYDHHATYRSWKFEEGLIPKKLDLREPCTQVVCGRRSTVCLLTSGTVWACGENDNLGVESENSVMKHPSKVKILEPIRELAATWFSNIFAASTWGGRIYCWGYKTRWPAVIADACVLIDAFRNKETPSSLGLVPVAPQLSPCASFNAKTTYRRSDVNLISPEVVAKLERSLSANDLTTSHYSQDKEIVEQNNTDSNGQAESSASKASQQAQSTSKSSKNLPPGLGLLITAGNF